MSLLRSMSLLGEIARFDSKTTGCHYLVLTQCPAAISRRALSDNAEPWSISLQIQQYNQLYIHTCIQLWTMTFVIGPLHGP